MLDSRRLTGPNLLLRGPGAILDVLLAPADPAAEDLIEAWRRHARSALTAVGWEAEELAARIFGCGLSVAMSAPVDALYAATEVNEWAWEQARRELAGEEAETAGAALSRLAELIEAESNPRLRELTSAAAEHQVACLRDDEHVSLGLGAGSRTWGVLEAPLASAVDWDQLHDVPLVLVTGTNGKSTTVRMLAAMATAAGLRPGVTSTDGVHVGGRCLDEGDWSGPGGARRVLREPEVELAILETARGGMLRRGLSVERADVAVITNVAADHLGEWGVSDVEELADAKLVVALAGERLVLNADDPVLAARAGDLMGPVTWFSLDPSQELVKAHVAAGRSAALLEGEELVLHEDGRRTVVTRIGSVPATLDGAARFNVANALAAIAAGAALGLPVSALAEGLHRFGSAASDNPGRLQPFEIDGATALVDFAHNPHGLQALLDTVAHLGPKRLLIVLGQAGDRDDEAIRELAHTAAGGRPDRVIVKEMTHYARGRPRGEVAGILVSALLDSGQPKATIERAADELAAARSALSWSRPGDLLLLLCHAQRDELLDMLRGLASRPKTD